MKKISLLNIISLLFFISSPLLACIELQGVPEISWVAFKTPQKIGVEGFFKELKRKGATTGKDLNELLSAQMVTLSAEDINTKNPARDKNIREAFFENLSTPQIQARVAKVTKKIIDLEIIMNGNKQTVPMTYTYKSSEQVLNASGHIDILDFQASKALKAINKRCFALHEGKTWSHVEIRLKQSFKKCK